ncbi:hypothetical protein ECEC1865_2770, partial [Escherichia coli EC1865]
LLQHARN